MSKEYSDSEIEEILDTKVKRAFVLFYQSFEERWIVLLATILILAGILLFVYAVERTKQ